jgi:hypothetical protein
MNLGRRHVCNNNLVFDLYNAPCRYRTALVSSSRSYRLIGANIHFFLFFSKNYFHILSFGVRANRLLTYLAPIDRPRSRIRSPSSAEGEEARTGKETTREEGCRSVEIIVDISVPPCSTAYVLYVRTFVGKFQLHAIST